MTPAGWYPDAKSDEVVRYWDGTQWTEERAWERRGVGRPAAREPGDPIRSRGAAAGARR